MTFPIIYPLNLCFERTSKVLFKSLGSMITVIPIPQLNIFNILLFSMLPNSWSVLKNDGIFQLSKYISEDNVFGIDLGIFSVRPPPVILAIDLTSTFFTKSRITLVYRYVGFYANSIMLLLSLSFNLDSWINLLINE